MIYLWECCIRGAEREVVIERKKEDMIYIRNKYKRTQKMGEKEVKGKRIMKIERKKE